MQGGWCFQRCGKWAGVAAHPVNISSCASGRDPALSSKQGSPYKRVIIGFARFRGGGSGGGRDRLFAMI
jgi:hypothetical protein